MFPTPRGTPASFSRCEHRCSYLSCHWSEPELSYRPVETPHYWLEALGASRRSRKPM
ncbi:hypothetical protein L916_04983 [Phytophthora nicotianae]|uniref:Uncharacterized protein n=1 Tax=Phytophthora nicotianae TaxID=4792 RepID=W2JG82_PHYNI|nr:hypothetical protein L916_04983 [Phytophthora nicotianae]